MKKERKNMPNPEKMNSREKPVLPEGYRIDESDPDIIELISPQGEVIGRYTHHATEIVNDAIKHSHDKENVV